MKRWFALCLALIQCCLLLACREPLGESPGGTMAEEPGRFIAGFSKRDITPKVSLPLDCL